MIKFTFEGKIKLTFNSSEEQIFNRCVSMAKLFNLRYSAKQKCWIVSAAKFDRVLDAFKDIDIVEVDPEDYNERLVELLSPTKELQYKPQRVQVDYNLMNFRPYKGKAPYEDYQHIDIRNALQRNRYALFLDMGLGKAYIFSVIFAHYFLKWKSVNKVLILSSGTGVRNLPEEFMKFIPNFSNLKFVVADKNNRKPFTEENDIVFSSYHTFRLISKAYQKKSSSKPRKAFIPFEQWFEGGEGLLILDESHQAANPSSQQGNFVAIHAPCFQYRYEGTGTPADKPEKLYNQLKILDKSLVHGFSFSEWKEYYAELGNHFSSTAITGWKEDKMIQLNKKMQEYSIFRKAEECLDLPDVIEKNIYCTLSNKHRRIYEAFTENVLQSNMYETGGYNVSRIVNLFPYLGLSLHNPKLLEKHFNKLPESLIKDIEKFDFLKDADSLEALKDVIEDRGKEKGIIWIIHPKTADYLVKAFSKLSPIVITGQTKEQERVQLIKVFKEEKKHQLLIANIDVLNTSYTITEATWQFYLERHYNYTTYSQSKKRIHRIGQDKTTRNYYSIYRGTVDILLDANLSNKGLLVDSLVSKKYLTKEQWKSILNPQSSSFTLKDTDEF